LVGLHFGVIDWISDESDLTVVIIMHVWLVAVSLSLVIAHGVAHAQTGAPPSSATLLPTARPPAGGAQPGLAETPEEIRAQAAEWHAQCMRDWDAETHMTRQEWTSTCRRVVDERVQWLLREAKQQQQQR